MDSAELIERLRREGGFRLLPLLGNTGQVAGVHLSRFLPGGHIEVIQAWDERWAAYARLPDSVDAAAPFLGQGEGLVRSGPFGRVVAPLLPIQSGPIAGTRAVHGREECALRFRGAARNGTDAGR